MFFKRFVSVLVLSTHLFSICPKIALGVKDDDVLSSFRSGDVTGSDTDALSDLNESDDLSQNSLFSDASGITSTSLISEHSTHQSLSPVGKMPGLTKKDTHTTIPLTDTSDDTSIDIKEMNSLVFQDQPDNVQVLIGSVVQEQNEHFPLWKVISLALVVLPATYFSDASVSRYFGESFGAGTGVLFYWVDDNNILHGSNYGGHATEGIIAPIVALKFARGATELFTPTQETPAKRKSFHARLFHTLYSPWFRDANDSEQPSHGRTILNKCAWLVVFANVGIPVAMDLFSYYQDNSDINGQITAALSIFPYLYFRMDPTLTAAYNFFDRFRFSPLKKTLSFIGIGMSERFEQEAEIKSLDHKLDAHNSNVPSLSDEVLNSLVDDNHILSKEALWEYLGTDIQVIAKKTEPRLLRWTKKTAFLMPLAAYAFYKIGNASATNSISNVFPNADLASKKYQAAIQTQATTSSLIGVLTQILAVHRFFTLAYDHFFGENTPTLSRIRKGMAGYAIMMGLWMAMETIFDGRSLLSYQTFPEKIIMCISLVFAYGGKAANNSARFIQDADAGLNVLSQRISKKNNPHHKRAQKIERVQAAIKSIKAKVPNMPKHLRKNLLESFNVKSLHQGTIEEIELQP